MHLSFEELDCDLEYDLCIIGAGAAGLTIASEWADKHPNSKTPKVLLLESGKDSAKERLYWPWAEIMKYVDPRAQTLYQGSVSGILNEVDPEFLTRSRSRVYGGSTNCWGGWTHPLSPVDFQTRAWNNAEGYASPGWPMAYDELARHYPKAMRICHLDFEQSDRRRPLPDLYHDTNFWSTHDPLVQAFDTSSEDLLETSVFQIIKPFYCRFGRDEVLGGKIKEAKNIWCVKNANVTTLVQSPNKGEITEVVVKPLKGGSLTGYKSGPSKTVRAKKYILAAGAIESVRLMLLSKITDQSGWLGKGFTGHPMFYCGAKFTFKPDLDRDQYEKIQRFYSHESTADFSTYASRFQATLIPKKSALLSEGIGNFRLMIDLPPTFSEGKNIEGRVNISWEEPGLKGNYISLSSTSDSLGMPKTHLHWDLSEKSKHTFTTALKLAESHLRNKLSITDFKALETSGPGWPTEDLENNSMAMGDHHLGCARMSADPNTGVLDPNLKAHHYTNLYVAGSAAFPVSGFANPTLTIIALALRLSDHLKSACQ